MATELKLNPSKTYATKANAIKAVDKWSADPQSRLTYVLVQNDEGRWFPIFIGERALQAGAHFAGFCVTL